MQILFKFGQRIGLHLLSLCFELQRDISKINNAYKIFLTKVQDLIFQGLDYEICNVI